MVAIVPGWAGDLDRGRVPRQRCRRRRCGPGCHSPVVGILGVGERAHPEAAVEVGVDRPLCRSRRDRAVELTPVTASVDDDDSSSVWVDRLDPARASAGRRRRLGSPAPATSGRAARPVGPRRAASSPPAVRRRGRNTANHSIALRRTLLDTVGTDRGRADPPLPTGGLGESTREPSAEVGEHGADAVWVVRAHIAVGVDHGRRRSAAEPADTGQGDLAFGDQRRRPARRNAVDAEAVRQGPLRPTPSRPGRARQGWARRRSVRRATRRRSTSRRPRRRRGG